MQSATDKVKDILTEYGIEKPTVTIAHDNRHMKTYVRVSGFVGDTEYHSMSVALGNPKTPEELLAGILAHPLQRVHDEKNPTS